MKTKSKLATAAKPSPRFDGSIWIAYKYTTIDRVESLSIGMICTDEEKLREFADKNGWKVEQAKDGEMFPL